MMKQAKGSLLAEIMILGSAAPRARLIIAMTAAFLLLRCESWAAFFLVLPVVRRTWHDCRGPAAEIRSFVRRHRTAKEEPLSAFALFEA